jgi:DHA2 family multidrug resistance protein
LKAERGNPEVLQTIDWPNYLALTFGLAMMLFAISEGERHFWLEAWWVPALILGGAILVAAAAYALLHAKGPRLIELSVFRRPTFAWGITLSFFFRFGLLFAIYIVPAFLGRVQGFRPAQTGEILVLISPATLVGLTAAWYLAYRVDSRVLLSAGLAMFALAAWLCVGLEASWAADQLRRAAMVAGVGLGLFGVGVLRFSSYGASPVDGPTVGVVFNLARVFGNIGGLAILIHLVTEREKFHSANLVESLSATDPNTAQRLATMTGAFGQMNADAGIAQASATSALARAASNQAFTLAFADSLTITAIALGVGAILVWALPGIPYAVSGQLPQRKLA